MRSTTHRAAAAALALLALAAAITPAAAQQGGAKTQQASAARRVKQYTIEQFMDTVRVGGSSFSADEKEVLFHSNKTGIFNVYTVPAGGGEARQLTNSTKESTYAVSYFPADSRFIYTYDKGGNENNHLYVREPDGSERDLTPGEKTKANFLGWTQDRKSFFFSTNERDPRYFDLFEMTVADMKPTLVFRDEQGFQVADITNDRRYVALDKSGESTTDSDIYLYDTQTKELKKLTPHSGEISHNAQTFDPQSKYLYYTTDEGGEFAYLKRYDLATGKTEVVERAPWDIQGTYFSRNGKYRVTVINQDARTVIRLYEAATGKLVPLPKMPEGDITGVNISPSETRMAFYLNGDRSPANLHVYDFATKKVTRLTSSLNPEIDAADLVDAQIIRY